MTVVQWIRSQVEPASPAPRKRPSLVPEPRRTPTPAPIEELAIGAHELPAAWRPADNRLIVTTRSPVVRGRRVVVRIEGVAGVTSPLTGRVAGARPSAGGCVAEIEIDSDRRPLLRRVVKFLRGEAAAPRVRAPRYRLSIPVVVCSALGRTYMNTFSLSQGGCGLVWSGDRPRLGGGLHLRLGGGSKSAAFRAAVCWVSDEQGGLRVGVRFLDGDTSGLATLLDEVRRGAVAT